MWRVPIPDKPYLNRDCFLEYSQKCLSTENNSKSGRYRTDYTPYKLLDWIPKDKLVWRGLFENPKAIYYIEKYLCQWYPEYLQIVEHEQDSEDEIPDDEDCDFVNDHQDSENEFVKALSNNPNADHLLEILLTRLSPTDTFCFDLDLLEIIARNPNTIHLIERVLDQRQQKLFWDILYENYHTIHLTQKHFDECLKNPPKPDPEPPKDEWLERSIDWSQLFNNPGVPVDTHPDLGAAGEEVTTQEPLVASMNSKIDWNNISGHPFPHLNWEERQEWLKVINWTGLSRNSHPSAIEILEKYPNEINWTVFSGNHNTRAIEILSENVDKIDWTVFSGNSNPSALEILSQNVEQIDWTVFSGNSNPRALEMLAQNVSKIDWRRLSLNPNPKAIELIEQHMNRLDLVCWKYLSKHPDALHLLHKYPDKIDWENFSKNPSIFEIDYKFLKSRIEPIEEELFQKALHPERITKCLLTYKYDISEE